MTSHCRIGYLDAAKGFGMLSIIAGHMGSPIINEVVFTFHVPLFFFICGYLYKDKQAVKNRYRHLMVPYILTAISLIVLTDIREVINSLWKHKQVSVIQNTVDYIKAALYGSGVRTDFFYWTIKPIGAIWFLLALFISLLIYDFLYKVTQNVLEKKRRIIVGAVSLGLTLIAVISSFYTWLPFSVQSACAACIFLFFGMIVKKYSPDFNNKGIICGGIAVWILALFCSCKYGIMSLAECLFPNLPVNILGAGTASYVILAAFHALETKAGNSRIWRWLCILGRYSTAVLCVHLIEIRIIPWHYIRDINNIIMPYVIYIIKLLIASGTAVIAMKVKQNKRIAGEIRQK